MRGSVVQGDKSHEKSTKAIGLSPIWNAAALHLELLDAAKPDLPVALLVVGAEALLHYPVALVVPPSVPEASWNQVNVKKCSASAASVEVFVSPRRGATWCPITETCEPRGGLFLP
jgi:hypothetical protein